METGKIVRLNVERGLALVEPQGSAGLCYFWREDVLPPRFESLLVGQLVTYEAEHGRAPGPNDCELRHVTRVRPG